MCRRWVRRARMWRRDDNAGSAGDPRQLPEVLAPILGGRADLVVGQRRPTSRTAFPWHLRFANREVARRLRRRTRVRLADLGPVRAARREALLGLGLTLFSMNGPDIPEVKKIIRSTSLEHATQVARRVMSFDSERQVMHFLREETRKLVPEAF